MSIPAFLRTWQFQANQILAPQGSALATNRRLCRSIKESMKGSGAWTDTAGGAVASSGNWTVPSSCDGSGGAGSFGNGDNVDRWVTDANLIWAAAASNHSWIVLRQTGIAANFEVCIDLSNASTFVATIAVSFTAGFGSLAAGTATARPTATDEQILINNTNWGGVNGDTAHALHVLKTSDGSAIRIIVLRTSTNGSGAWTVLYWDFELPINTISAWTNPSASVALGSSTAAPISGLDTVGNLSNTANTFGRTPGGTNFSNTWVAESTQAHSLFTDSYGSVNGGQQCVNDVNHEAPLFAVRLYSATVNARGSNGGLADVRIGLENISTNFNAAGGRSYPDAAPLRQWVQFGDLVHPWNRSIPMVVS